jgi:hypothetical protein
MAADTAGPTLSLAPPRRAPNGVVLAGEFAFVPNALVTLDGVYRKQGVSLFEVSAAAALHAAGAPMGGWLPIGLALGTYPQDDPGNPPATPSVDRVTLAGKYAAFVRIGSAAPVYAGNADPASPGAPVTLASPEASHGASFAALGCAVPDGLGSSGTKFGAPWTAVVARPQPAFDLTKFKVEAFLWQTAHNKVIGLSFYPLFFFEGAPVCNSYVPGASALAAKQRTPVTDALACCQGASRGTALCGALGPSAPACAAALQRACGGANSAGEPNFVKPACVAWHKNSRTGKLAVDKLMGAWCASHPSDARCACIRAAANPADPGWQTFEAAHPSFAGLPPACVFPACTGATAAGQFSQMFMTGPLLAAAAAPLCESARGVAARQRSVQAAAAQRKKTQLEHAERRFALTQAYIAEQYIPVWEWLLFAAFVLICVSLFMYHTRHRVSVVVKRAGNADGIAPATSRPPFVL